MQKVKFHTITIKVPAEQVLLSKTGKIKLVPTFTKTGAITKRKGESAIIFEPDSYIIHPEIVDKGEVYNQSVEKIDQEIHSEINDDKILKFGMLENNNVHFKKFKKVDLDDPTQKESNLKVAFKKYIRYYFDNAYKILQKQDKPTNDELEAVSDICAQLKDPIRFWTVYHVNSPNIMHTFGDYLEEITDEEYKILMKIAYNDGINKNKKYYNKSVNLESL
jgi:hypothetical protein